MSDAFDDVLTAWLYVDSSTESTGGRFEPLVCLTSFVFITLFLLILERGKPQQEINVIGLIEMSTLICVDLCLFAVYSPVRCNGLGPCSLPRAGFTKK